MFVVVKIAEFERDIFNREFLPYATIIGSEYILEGKRLFMEQNAISIRLFSGIK